MFQFSLRNLLVAVSAVAVGTAALFNANTWWVSLLWAAVLMMLVLAGFAAYFRRGTQRAYWGGYLVAGSLYLLLLMYSVPQMSQTNTWMPFGPLNYSNLLTTKLVVWVYSLLPASKNSPSLLVPSMGGVGGMSGGGMAAGSMPGMGGNSSGGMMGTFGGMMGPPMTSNPNYIDQEAFTEVGQALWMLFLSWLGGTIAFGFSRKRGTAESCFLPHEVQNILHLGSGTSS